jgi:hypothetical protein
MDPYQFFNAINVTKENLMVDKATEKSYNSYIINRSLSYFPDTILFANEVNKMGHMDNHHKFHFFINTIRKRKRFSKWDKPINSDDLDIIKQYYGYSSDKARQVLSLLSTDKINELKQRMNKGGRSK